MLKAALSGLRFPTGNTTGAWAEVVIDLVRNGLFDQVSFRPGQPHDQQLSGHLSPIPFLSKSVGFQGKLLCRTEGNHGLFQLLP